MRIPLPAALAAALAVALLSCSKDEPNPGDTGGSGAGNPEAGEDGGADGGALMAAPTAESRRAARDVYDNGCVACHGATGAGDGAAALALDPKPRNYTDPAWQESVSDEHLAEVIVKGGQALGLSATMSAYPDLEPATVGALVEMIREFAE